MNLPDYRTLTQSSLVREFLASVERASGMAVKLVPTDPSDALGALGIHRHPVCALVGRSDGGRQSCQAFLVALQSRTAQACGPVQRRCFAGLTHVLMPVVIGGRPVAMLLAGQVFCRKPGQRDCVRLARLLRGWGDPISLRRAAEACSQTVTLSDAKLRAAGSLLRTTAEFLADSGNRWMLAAHDGEPVCVAAAKRCIRGRACEERLPVGDVARHVGLCPDHFTRVFKRATGMTFVEYLALVRVERAKELLPDPSARIGEVAYACGFGSISQFNRVFKNCTGTSPSAYCRTVRPGQGLVGGRVTRQIPVARLVGPGSVGHSERLTKPRLP